MPINLQIPQAADNLSAENASWKSYQRHRIPLSPADSGLADCEQRLSGASTPKYTINPAGACRVLWCRCTEPVCTRRLCAVNSLAQRLDTSGNRRYDGCCSGARSIVNRIGAFVLI